MDRLRQFLKYTPVDTTRIKEKLPQVHLFGFEKSYGAPQPQDYQSMINNYKSWAYACAWKNAISVAQVELCIYKKSYDSINNKETLDKIGQHPFLDVIKSVNPFSNKFELFTITQTFLELTGNAYWWIPRNALGVPYMIWNIPSNWVRIIPSKTKFIEGYVVQVPGQGEVVPFDEEEVIHFKYPSPFNLFYGTGPMYAAMFGIDLNNQIKTWGINYFMNNANPGGILTTENSLSEPQYQRLKAQWNEKYRGSKNAGKMAFLEGGLKYEQTGSTMVDARMETVSRDVRDEILAMFGVPASKLGLVEDVNRANADANDYTYQKDTIRPRLLLIEEKLNEKMIPIYDDNLVCKFVDAVPEDKEYKLKERQANIQMGLTTIDEEREKGGLEPFNLPQTSVPLIPFNLVPAGEEREQEDEQKFEEEKTKASSSQSKWEVFVNISTPQERLFAETLKRFFSSQHSEVMKNLNKFKEVGESINKDLAGFILFNMREANQKLKDKSRSHIKTAFITGIELGVKETKHPIDFNLFNPNILRAVEQRMDFFVQKNNESTANLLRDELNDGLSKGETLEELSRRVDKVFKYKEDFSSKRTAQTEVIGAINDGQLKSYIEAGIDKKKWITARDERVRESHQIDGQEQDIIQSFRLNSGVTLLYPGDRSGLAPAEEIINCRCTVQAVL